MRGRPVASTIRQNIINILFYLKRGYGYEIYKIYEEIFPKVTMRSIYYHLKKGVSTSEIIFEEAITEDGDYSWGSSVEKNYYSLGKNARPIESKRIKNAVNKYINKTKSK